MNVVYDKYVYKIEPYNNHYKVTEYKEYFKGYFLSETGYTQECDTYEECEDFILERSKETC